MNPGMLNNDKLKIEKMNIGERDIITEINEHTLSSSSMCTSLLAQKTTNHIYGLSCIQNFVNTLSASTNLRNLDTFLDLIITGCYQTQ